MTEGIEGGEEQRPKPASEIPSDELGHDVELTRLELARTAGEVRRRLNPKARAGDMAYESVRRAERAGTDFGEFLRELPHDRARRLKAARVGGVVAGAAGALGLLLWLLIRRGGKREAC